MEPDVDLTALDATLLNEALAKARDELLDVQEERELILGQTGVHIGANELARLRRAWERDETRLQAWIAEIEARLAELEPSR